MTSVKTKGVVYSGVPYVVRLHESFLELWMYGTLPFITFWCKEKSNTVILRSNASKRKGWNLFLQVIHNANVEQLFGILLAG